MHAAENGRSRFYCATGWKIIDENMLHRISVALLLWRCQRSDRKMNKQQYVLFSLVLMDAAEGILLCLLSTSLSVFLSATKRGSRASLCPPISNARSLSAVIVSSFISHIAPSVTSCYLFLSASFFSPPVTHTWTHTRVHTHTNTQPQPPLLSAHLHILFFLDWIGGGVCSPIWCVKFQQWKRGWRVAF